MLVYHGFEFFVSASVGYADEDTGPVYELDLLLECHVPQHILRWVLSQLLQHFETEKKQKMQKKFAQKTTRNPLEVRPDSVKKKST